MDWTARRAGLLLVAGGLAGGAFLAVRIADASEDARRADTVPACAAGVGRVDRADCYAVRNVRVSGRHSAREGRDSGSVWTVTFDADRSDVRAHSATFPEPRPVYEAAERGTRLTAHVFEGEVIRMATAGPPAQDTSTHPRKTLLRHLNALTWVAGALMLGGLLLFTSVLRWLGPGGRWRIPPVNVLLLGTLAGMGAHVYHRVFPATEEQLVWLWVRDLGYGFVGIAGFLVLYVAGRRLSSQSHDSAHGDPAVPDRVQSRSGV